MSNATRAPVAITGYGWELPSLGNPRNLADVLCQPVASAIPFAPEDKLGKKGLRYKERATLLALCAAKSALQHAGWLDDTTEKLEAPDFGVVVASNTGNFDTVCGAADTIRREHVDATSSMDLPNASSNVIASTIAIRFGLQAINLMVCSGSSAALDALVLAANTIRNGRAKRMLVVAVESDGVALRSLLAQQRLTALEGEAPILEGACAVVLEAAEETLASHANVYGLLTDYAYVHADAPDAHPIYNLLDRHQRKIKYLSGASFAKALYERGFGAADDTVIDLGDHVLRSYGSAALLQLLHYCEQQGGVTATAKEAGGHGAVIMAGGVWADRRAGAVVVLAPPAAGEGAAL
ncbi:beta-ketoacyl synthase N-terminal-like domain-containing protein [Collimonas humicola]|uniref:beta-ketoacyl synthase N-terminal-like domain-containing protein n=1 Tax=Collimonas humicola TaxID=2825886 RepID=UPI001B8B372A|nr:beta-ketoacyl synthase N-terminal-like domain-containing protein [Collimonas humicola]